MIAALSRTPLANRDPSAGRREHAGRKAQQRGLARAVGSQQPDDLSLIHIEADRTDTIVLAVELADVLQRKEHCSAARPSDFETFRL